MFFNNLHFFSILLKFTRIYPQIMYGCSGLPLWCPALWHQNQLKSLKADIFLVVAYRILPEKIIEIPKHGAINLHVSLLPKYRGAAPIQWALMNGDTETGVTIFQINRKVDTGDILVQKKFPIYKDDNMLTLGTRLCNSGAEIMIDAIGKIEEGSIEILKQTQESVSFAPKITKMFPVVFSF